MWFLVICVLTVPSVFGVYFTMRNIELTIPSDKGKLPPENHPLLTLFAQSDSNDENLRYSINDTHGYLQIYATTGDVLFTKKFFRNDIKTMDKISSNISVEDSRGKRDWTTFQVNISPLQHLNCDYIVSDLCFWSNVKYRLKESFRPTIIGSITSSYINEMCPTYKVDYQLRSGFDDFKLIKPHGNNKFWSLATIIPLNRHVQGDQAALSIKCIVKNATGSMWEPEKDDVLVEIIDEDNYPPVPQEKEIVIKTDTNFFTKDHVVENPHMMFTDKDTPGVNHYDAIVLSENNTTLLQPYCQTYSDSRNGDNQTAIHCKLKFTRNNEFSDTSNTVVLQLNDTTLKNASANSTARLLIHFKLNDNSVQMQPLILYPHHEVKVFRTAAAFARVTQPNHFKDCSDFTITEDSPSKNIFHITNTEGIVFVFEFKELRNLPKSIQYIRLNITWKRKKKIEQDVIKVKLIDEPTKTCSNVTGLSDWTYCSEFKTYNECIKSTSCALSTGGSPSVANRKGPERCMWRGDKIPPQEIGHLYSTCTPDVNTCPDGICDSLENLNYLICPQDCSVNIHFPTLKNNETGRGIDKASGVCFCTINGACMCKIPANKKDRKNNTDKKYKSLKKTDVGSTILPAIQPNVSLLVGNFSDNLLGFELAKCGTTCVMGILAGTLFLGGAVALIVICWRLERVHKAVRGKYNEDSQDMFAPLSDYIDRNINSEPLPLNFQMTTSLEETTTLGIFKKYEPDPKWEFPRSQLIIEQTLGEGEFGRVLRAKALDIGGHSGYKTVAVKTLKDDARETELNDLLSEYQLLKEVSHPNVIRLLGVCTTPGGPVYLIIEFAEHGSLRNYLRKSRHLKSDSSRFPSSSDGIDDSTTAHYDEPNLVKVTPKEVMSFAWQICNGMAYLTDIKLVHRDLAARNVLVAGDKICKISDFGLTRDIYEDNAYFKRSKGRVPVKWMAPESLADHIYTSKSDVWSFGILVWELVTLGATPYPGIAVQNLFHLLRQGYRMERPDNCSVALYKIMRSCWHIDPEKRPSFQELAKQLEKMLGDGTEYLDLTNNAIHNRSYFCSPFEEIEGSFNFDEAEENNVNYLTKSYSYEKCGATEKLLNEENKLVTSDTNQNISTQDYESPVKFSKKVIQTPTNECPQEYTDMESGKCK